VPYIYPMPIQEFYCKKTEALFRDGVCDKAWRSFDRVARRKLATLNSAKIMSDLKLPGNHLEKLERDRTGQHSIRINDKYRLCFIWQSDGPYRVEITDHYK
jgi:proteic killer suppression protein